MTTEDTDRCGPPVAVYRAAHLGRSRIEWRSAARPPSNNYVGIIYRRDDEGGLTQAGVGVHKDGQWTNDKGKALEPDGLFWTAFIDD